MPEMLYTEASALALREILERDPTAFLIGTEMGEQGGAFHTAIGLQKQFGSTRIRDLPACERAIMGICVGAALAGARPMVDLMYANYLLYAAGDLAHHVSGIPRLSGNRIHLPIVMRAAIGIGLGGGPFHSGNFHSLFACLPGLHVVAPTGPRDVRELLHGAARCNEPVILLEHRRLLAMRGEVPESSEPADLTKARIVREGDALTLVAYGGMVADCLKAADQLASRNISAEVVNLRSLAPLDGETLVASVARTGRLLLVDDAYLPCSILSEVAALIAGTGLDYLDAPIARLGGRHDVPPYAPTLERAAAPSVEDILRAADKLLAF